MKFVGVQLDVCGVDDSEVKFEVTLGIVLWEEGGRLLTRVGRGGYLRGGRAVLIGACCCDRFGADRDVSLSICSPTSDPSSHELWYALNLAREAVPLHTKHDCVASLWLNNKDDELQVC